MVKIGQLFNNNDRTVVSQPQLSGGKVVVFKWTSEIFRTSEFFYFSRPSSLFGRPLNTDNAISIGSRHSVARVLVEQVITPIRCGLVLINSSTYNKLKWRSSLLFYRYYKSLGHSKADYHILHTHLNDVIAGDMATNNLGLNGCSTVVPMKIVKNLDNMAMNPTLSNVAVVDWVQFFSPLLVGGWSLGVERWWFCFLWAYALDMF
ncbi:hypothetical protein IEQ34_000343 [Dendrobium chrysotoxum]|uniref:Uncharacterized protein n=1 Tax=Dendrobium chrysotoxum TaxID=161865 RepID=A0AAV7HR25_DENCH|nr:hypothetical protein IEQ34_000343 [Dendrobium chrysotoxum]